MTPLLPSVVRGHPIKVSFATKVPGLPPPEDGYCFQYVKACHTAEDLGICRPLRGAGAVRPSSNRSPAQLAASGTGNALTPLREFKAPSSSVIRDFFSLFGSVGPQGEERQALS